MPWMQLDAINNIKAGGPNLTATEKLWITQLIEGKNTYILNISITLQWSSITRLWHAESRGWLIYTYLIFYIQTSPLNICRWLSMAVTFRFYYSFAIARVAGTGVSTLATASSTATAILSGYGNRIVEITIVRSRGRKKRCLHRLLTERKVADTVASLAARAALAAIAAPAISSTARHFSAQRESNSSRANSKTKAQNPRNPKHQDR